MKKPTVQDVRNGIGGFVSGLAVLANVFLPAVPAIAQNTPRPTGQKLEAGKELTFTCVNVQPWEGKGYTIPFIDRTLDLDGDIRTTKDQVHDIRALEWLDKNPKFIMKIGDEVVAILTAKSIKDRDSGYVKFINGQDIR